jgi:Tfp pilus assembly protein PilF
MAARAEVPAFHAFRRTLLGGIAAIAALFFADTFLAKTERAESHVEAERHYQSGRRFMQSGQSARAVEEFRSALAVERENEDYQLALGQGLLAAGSPTEAEATLNALLQENPFGGPPNLAMARVMVKEGKLADAASYYHRAIYGQWKENAGADQLRVRFELVELLSRQDSKEALLAELLPLQDEAPGDFATQERLGRWFLMAGSGARAAPIFQEILRREPRNSAAHAGLGEAAFVRGNYRNARNEFQAALRLGSEDPDIRARFELCEQILLLDPTLRGLGPEEQSRRGQRLAQLALSSLMQCAGEAPSIKADEARLRGKLSYDDRLDLAEELWRTRQTDCKQAILPTEEPLAIVLSGISQK